MGSPLRFVPPELSVSWQPVLVLAFLFPQHAPVLSFRVPEGARLYHLPLPSHHRHRACCLVSRSVVSFGWRGAPLRLSLQHEDYDVFIRYPHNQASTVGDMGIIVLILDLFDSLATTQQRYIRRYDPVFFSPYH